MPFIKRKGKLSGLSQNTDRQETNIERIVNAKIHRATKGYHVRPPLTPPQFSFQPFNNVTLRMKKVVASTLWVKASQVVNDLASQLGLYYSSVTATGTTNYRIGLEFSVLKVYAWNLSDDVGVLKLAPIDFGDNDQSPSELVNIGSTSQKNMYACAGYVWPSSLQNKVFQFDAGKITTTEENLQGDDQEILFIDAEASATVEIHLYLKWRARYSADLKLQYEYNTNKPMDPKRHPNSTIKTLIDVHALATDIAKLINIPRNLALDEYAQQPEQAISETPRQRDDSGLLEDSESSFECLPTVRRTTRAFKPVDRFTP